jgi:hypothetical protein
MAKCEEGRKESRRGTGVANEKFGFAGRDSASQACYHHRVIAFVELDSKAKRLEGLRKILRVI